MMDDRLTRDNVILDPRPSILDPLSSTLDPLSSILDPLSSTLLSGLRAFWLLVIFPAFPRSLNHSQIFEPLFGSPPEYREEIFHDERGRNHDRQRNIRRRRFGSRGVCRASGRP